VYHVPDMMGEFIVSALFWQNAMETPVEVPAANKYAQSETVKAPEDPRKKSTYAYHMAQRKKTDAFLHRHRKKLQARSFRPPVAQKTISDSKKPNLTMVFASHPDDEILCCSHKIREKLEAGNRVKIVYITDGDAINKSNAEKAREYARTRQDESITAASSLGLSRYDLFFLGFPDGHLKALGSEPLTSDYSDRSKTPPGSFRPGSLYTREALLDNLEKVITRFDPDEIFVPSSHLDRHADHQETHHLVREALERTKHTTKLQTYVVHNLEFWLENKSSVNPWKLRLIRHFKSQFHDDWHQTFLERFAALPEKFYPVDEEVVKSVD